MRKLMVVTVAAGALLVGAGASHAAIDKCQKRIQSEGAKLQKFVYGALQKCADAIRKEKAAAVVKGGDDCSPGKACLANAAAFCEKQLATVYDAANAKPNKSKFELFRAAMEKASFHATDPNKAECTDSDLRLLEGMGHQLSGGGNGVNLATAPPATGACDLNSDGKADINCRLRFLTDWLMFAIEDAAIKQLLAQTPDLMALLKSAIDATSTNPAKPATDCSNPSAPGYRPNLCRFGVECFTAVCSLDSGSSNATLTVPSLFPLPPIGLVGSLSTSVCRPGGTTTNQLGLGAEFGTNPNTIYLINSAARTIRAGSIPSPLSLLINAVCVDVLGSQGWCDCSGQGVNVNASVCQDRIGGCDASADANCLPGTDLTDECGVAATTFVADGQFPDSNSHSPQPSITPSGASTAGDCVDFVTLQFKLLQSSQLGPDGLPCTDDDTAAPLASVTAPLTTGTVTVTLEDLIQAAGQCTAVSGTPPCLTDADCSAGTCDTSARNIIVSSSTVSGAKPSANQCARYTGGDLSGLKFVTGLALADLALPAPLNTSVDGTLTVELVCQ